MDQITFLPFEIWKNSFAYVIKLKLQNGMSTSTICRICICTLSIYMSEKQGGLCFLGALLINLLK